MLTASVGLHPSEALAIIVRSEGQLQVSPHQNGGDASVLMTVLQLPNSKVSLAVCFAACNGSQIGLASGET
jgi:hypothetical protein